MYFSIVIDVDVEEMSEEVADSNVQDVPAHSSSLHSTGIFCVSAVNFIFLNHVLNNF